MWSENPAEAGRVLVADWCVAVRNQSGMSTALRRSGKQFPDGAERFQRSVRTIRAFPLAPAASVHSHELHAYRSQHRSTKGGDRRGPTVNRAPRPASGLAPRSLNPNADSLSWLLPPTSLKSTGHFTLDFALQLVAQAGVTAEPAGFSAVSPSFCHNRHRGVSRACELGASFIPHNSVAICWRVTGTPRRRKKIEPHLFRAPQLDGGLTAASDRARQVHHQIAEPQTRRRRGLGWRAPQQGSHSGQQLRHIAGLARVVGRPRRRGPALAPPPS